MNGNEIVKTSNFVPALPSGKSIQMPTDLMAIDNQSQPLALMQQSEMQQVHEKTSGMDRARSTVERAKPMTGILAVLAVGMMWQFEISAGWAVLIFAGLTIAGYWLLNQLDYTHSASGLERHRINRSVDVRKLELEHNYKLRTLAMQAYFKLLERHNDHH